MYCNRCGHRNPEGANFCSSCGAPLEVASEAVTTITFHPLDPGEPPSGAEVAVTVHPDDLSTGVLLVTRGPNAGSRFELGPGVTTVGRHPDSDVFLDDVTVSRRHAEVAHVDDGLVVTDTGSLNGTYLNRERIEDHAELRHGDELQVGKFRLLLLTEP